MIKVSYELKSLKNLTTIKPYLVEAKQTTIRLSESKVPYLNGDLWRSIYGNINTADAKVESGLSYADVYTKDYNFNKSYHSEATNNALEKTYEQNESKINSALDALAEKRGDFS